MLGVVKLVLPLDNATPPDDAAYQSIVLPATAVADIETVPVPHLELLTGDVGTPGTALTVAVTAVRVADTQPVVVFLDSA